jgi:LPXTG-motif cell wall-anchored protein
MSYEITGRGVGLGADDAIVACGKYTRKDLQRKLADLGYYHGPIDGEPSPAFLAAIAQFMADKGLPLDASEEQICAALDEAGSSWKTALVIGGISVVAIGAAWLLLRKKK